MGLEDYIKCVAPYEMSNSWPLEALKAQEPVKPIFDYDGNDVWRCGNCHCNIFHPSRTDADENEKNYRRFCFHCGQAVKWE